ncbi:MAG: hypothetical protein ACR2PX_09275, partial [Endozoicomonas sp.]|uniref:hypothetical protein n=1 Tax=Endozoicomonas sp. TaxID=1892382 RepID=UPI003D9B9EBD
GLTWIPEKPPEIGVEGYPDDPDAQQVIIYTTPISEASGPISLQLPATEGELVILWSPEAHRGVPVYYSQGHADGLIGKDFEDHLVEYLEGKGSFKAGGREFDGTIGSRWYEAKSGNYWKDQCQEGPQFEKFKSDMGRRKSIAEQNGTTYELYTNSKIPEYVKKYLDRKGIPYTELIGEG